MCLRSLAEEGLQRHRAEGVTSLLEIHAKLVEPAVGADVLSEKKHHISIPWKEVPFLMTIHAID